MKQDPVRDSECSDGELKDLIAKYYMPGPGHYPSRWMENTIILDCSFSITLE